MIHKWKVAARTIKRQSYILYLAYRDPRTPWYGKLWAALVVAYAFSPIDLVPDPIPVLGYLDDLVLLALRLMPPAVLADARAQAAEQAAKPVIWVGAVIVVLIWIALAILIMALVI